MSTPHCLVWNVRGLNGRARRNVVKDLIIQERPSIVCLQETKLAASCTAKITDTLGSLFAYDSLPAVNLSGGILLGWRPDVWSVADVVKGTYSLSARVAEVERPGLQWWITVVYGPQLDADKALFLQELVAFRADHHGPWLLCGDFNMIYRAADKNNGRLDRRNMRRF